MTHINERLARAAIPVVGLLLIFSAAQAQLSEKYSNYKQSSYMGLRYGLFKPADVDSKKSYPLVVYLHGSTDTVSRDSKWYQPAIQNEQPLFMLTPKCTVADQGWGNTWTDGHTEATAKTLALVDSLIKIYPIDVNRLYIYGISMGGFGTLSVLQKEPGKFAAGYVVCGGGSEKAVDKLLDAPLWIFHGEEDDIVLMKYSKQVYDEIIRLGGKKARFTSYPGVKHNSWENVDKEEALPVWLLSQRKGK
ncbi:MAG: prolyl oligopeptidase family serine peptidase [Imperialibacter sp.]|uniref:carboxylesterase family protein n=1 Tax=Imperialibacter sp. TaxID=2038411 RepID=UPI0032ED7CA3